MKRLGYQEYMVQCGDWGHFVGRELGSKYTQSCKLLHFNFAPSPLPPGVEYTPREKAVAERVDDWLENHIGYALSNMYALPLYLEIVYSNTIFTSRIVLELH